MTHKTIEVGYLARVEGEGSLDVSIRDGAVEDVRLSIFEPPRFFEAFLRGRAFSEAPDITARICGICPIAYQMSACQAMEDALGVTVDGPLRDLRRLIYCGEWIESHTLHVYMLHAPDFLGYAGAIEMARDHAATVQRGLQLKKAGNEIVALIGGREVHPINVRVGGFYRVPKKNALAPLRETLERARDRALETVRWVAGFDFPPCERDYEFVALVHPNEYPMNEGRIVSSRGLDIPVHAFADHFEEHQVAYSTALQARIKARGHYLVGPAARYSLNAAKLSPLARDAATAAGLGEVCRNPYQSIVVRSVEVLYACDEALRLVDAYVEPDRPYVPFDVRSGTGYGCTEAPRGILHHRYAIDAEGTILEAEIVPPTSQNQPSIEDDLRAFIPAWSNLADDALQWRCEQTIRNYDPCISCATHFLKLNVQRQ